MIAQLSFYQHDPSYLWPQPAPAPLQCQLACGSTSDEVTRAHPRTRRLGATAGDPPTRLYSQFEVQGATQNLLHAYVAATHVFFHVPRLLARNTAMRSVSWLAKTAMSTLPPCMPADTASTMPAGLLGVWLRPGHLALEAACGRMARPAPAAAGVLNGELRPERPGPRSRGASFGSVIA